MPRLNIYKNEKETHQAVADWIGQLMVEKLSTSRSFNIAIPVTDKLKPVLKFLAASTANIDWSRLYVYTSKQKVNNAVDGKHDHPLQKLLPVTEQQVHFLPSQVSPQQAAEQYNNLLQNNLANAAGFDLVLLTLDNTTSIAVNGDNITTDDFEQWVLPVSNEDNSETYICLTTAAINKAKTKAFIATGKDRQAAVQQILKGKYNPEKYPAQLIQTDNKTIYWFLDEAAAASLTKPIA